MKANLRNISLQVNVLFLVIIISILVYFGLNFDKSTIAIAAIIFLIWISWITNYQSKSSKVENNRIITKNKYIFFGTSFNQWFPEIENSNRYLEINEIVKIYKSYHVISMRGTRWNWRVTLINSNSLEFPLNYSVKRKEEFKNLIKQILKVNPNIQTDDFVKKLLA